MELFIWNFNSCKMTLWYNYVMEIAWIQLLYKYICSHSCRYFSFEYFSLRFLLSSTPLYLGQRKKILLFFMTTLLKFNATLQEFQTVLAKFIKSQLTPSFVPFRFSFSSGFHNLSKYFVGIWSPQHMIRANCLLNVYWIVKLLDGVSQASSSLYNYQNI